MDAGWRRGQGGQLIRSKNHVNEHDRRPKLREIEHVYGELHGTHECVEGAGL